MKKILILLLVCCSLSVFGQNQKIEVTKLDSIAFDADAFVGFDGFGNCFYVKSNVLFKKENTTLLQYQNVSLGKIKKVDVLNPLKVVVFYEEFNSVVLLDNQLNEILKIDFSKNDTPIIASAVGISGQNKLWVYNSINQQIGLFDTATNKYKNLGVPIKENLLFYQTDFNYFNWIDIQNQWFSCSIFGRVVNNGSLKFQDKMQLLEKNRVLYVTENSLCLLDRNSSVLYKIEIIEKSFNNFYYKDQILSIFTNHGITNYKIIVP